MSNDIYISNITVNSTIHRHYDPPKTESYVNFHLSKKTTGEFIQIVSFSNITPAQIERIRKIQDDLKLNRMKNQ